MPYIEKENGERRTDIMSFYEKKSHDTKAAADKQNTLDVHNLLERLRAQTTVAESFADVDIRDIKLPMIAVFKNPDDYPDRYVARLFDGDKATDIAVIRENVEELRGDIHFAFWGMVPFQRGAEDVKCLIEVWL